MNFRLLRANEINCRVSTIKDKGLSLLLYKDARVDQNILDETFGIFGWQRSHQLIGDRLYCTVSVKNPETGEWISKQDVGVESNTEEEKGQASDSFKRACFNFGIGRELYTAPFIWVKAGNYEVINRNGKLSTFDRFCVKEIDYTDGAISHLVIINESQKGKIVYTLGGQNEQQSTAPAANDQRERIWKTPIGQLDGGAAYVNSLKEKLKESLVSDSWFLSMNKTDSFEDLSFAKYQSAMQNMSKIVSMFQADQLGKQEQTRKVNINDI